MQFYLFTITHLVAKFKVSDYHLCENSKRHFSQLVIHVIS